MRRPRPPRAPRALALALATTLGAGAVLAESGTVLKATELRSEPQASADVVGKLAAKQAVEITGRQGAWIGVKTDAGLEGWTRILNLRTGAGQAEGGGDALAAVFKSGSRGSSVATAVKGLSADELMSASANTADVALLDQYAASPGEANAFAAEVPLATTDVAYLKDDRRSRRRNR
ncbi:MAG TPA: SH3 domain-containing protein [Arenimonas sp.]|uniref:SH3 domain-containing protein n=1 Tax=Arenimonas sp. TaxID=1872635 RepID=UPI002D7E7086|nr:SH3 domain-containing protein [Arenimonas sp.]HEU0152517.1 SH3 domain-containing protein [Arenimonas sp.]